MPQDEVFGDRQPQSAARDSLRAVTGPQLMDALWNRRKIRVRAQDDKMVRQSCHFYNSPAEIDATLEIAKALASG